MSSGRKKNKTGNFNQNDRERLDENYKQLTEILDEIKSLQKEVSANKDEIEQLKIENLKLKQAAYLNIFHTDNLEQYRRRENIRIYGISESTSYNSKDDGETSLLKIATALQIDLEPKIFKGFIVLEKENIRRRPSHAQSLLDLFCIKKENNFCIQNPNLKRLVNLTTRISPKI